MLTEAEYFTTGDKYSKTGVETVNKKPYKLKPLINMGLYRSTLRVAIIFMFHSHSADRKILRPSKLLCPSKLLRSEVILL